MFLTIALLTSQTASAQSVQGAQAVLTHIRKVTGDKKTFVAATSLRSEMLAYATACDTMTAEQAAHGWLKLVDDIHRSWRNGPVKDGPRTADSVAVLPPPADWAAIKARIDAIPATKRTAQDLALELLFEELSGQRAQERATLGAFIRKLPSGPANRSAEWSARQLEVRLAQRSGDKAWIAEAVERCIDTTGSFWMGVSGGDIVSVLGEARARAVIKRLLTKPSQPGFDASFNFFPPFGGVDSGRMTKLLIEVVAANLTELRAAPWSLAATIPTASLYPVLAKRWPATGQDPNESMSGLNRAEAKVVYAVSLELAGKHEQALAQSNDLDWPKGRGAVQVTLRGSLDKPEYQRAFFDLESAAATKSPDAVLWREFGEVAKGLGRLDEYSHLAQGVKLEGDAARELRDEIADVRINALLAADQLDEAAALLEAQAAESANPNRSTSYGKAPGLRLALIGHLTGHPDWVERGIRLASKSPNLENEYLQLRDQTMRLTELFEKVGRGADAEARMVKSILAQPNGTHLTSFEALVHLYFAANRPADVLALFEQAPGWGGNDLVDVYFGQYAYTRGAPTGFYAAWALARTGRKDDAYRVLLPTLYFARSCDRGYELLLDLKGADAIPLLDELAARDRFEARPLIWKAEALRRAGRLEEAEKVARSAISLDPSDGESPHGDRLRAYVVLADIRAARGAAEEAAQLRNAVEAIRMAERADDLIDAGLIKRGTDLYKSALAKFDDAYCIQSRLALQLAAEGKPDEAAEHFRRAFELMPSSFGRMESHCLGCEGVFTGAQSQNIAMTTLRDMEAKSPDNPRIHYLLGYILEDEKKPEAALSEFKRATDLDPDYINAWIALSRVAGGRDEALGLKAALAVVRLDPFEFHRNWWTDPTPPAALWKAIHDAKLVNHLIPRHLMPIHSGADTASGFSAAWSREADWPQVGRFGNGANLPWRVPVTPSLRVSGLTFVSEIAELLSGDEQRNGFFGG